MCLVKKSTVLLSRSPDHLPSVPSGLEENPKAVLQTMRKYIVNFFGCQECGKHFEEMAVASLPQVKSVDQAVLWLWRKHNQVNGRLAGGEPTSISASFEISNLTWRIYCH